MVAVSMIRPALKVTAVLFVLLVRLAAAQPLPIAHDRWGLEDGLPQSSVTAILQGRDGYLWLGTFGGLARFDGVHFRAFVPANTAGMVSNRILSLAEDDAGDVLIGTEDSGLLRLHGERAELLAAMPDLPSDEVRAVLPEGRDVLWVGTREGLVRLENGRPTARWGREQGLPSIGITALARDADGSLWIATGRGIARFAGGRLESWAGRGAPFDRGAPALAAADGDLWVLNPDRLSRVRSGVVAGTWAVPAEESSIGALLRDRSGTVWIGGRSLAHLAGDRLVVAAAPAELRGFVIRALAQDREGGIWVGSDGGGLVRFRRARATTLTTSEGIAAGSVTVVTQDHAGTLWVASGCGGLAHSRADGSFAPLLRPDGRSYGCVSALLVDRAGELWVGGDRLDRPFDPAWRSLGPADGLPAGVHALIEAGDGTIWVGGEAGLARLSGGIVTRVGTAAELAGGHVRALFEASDGAIWIGTTHGVARYREGRLEVPPGAAGLPPIGVRAFHETAGGAVWMGTYGGGLVRLHAGRARVVGTADGLADDVVSCILPDLSGDLWLSGNKGISRVAVQDLEAVADGIGERVVPLVLGSRDGMTSAECNGGNQPAGWRAADGRLYFPTIAGLARVDPRQMPRNTLPPAVVIEEVRIEGRRAAPRAEVVVPPGARNLEIQFTALSFNDPRALRFRYRMEGFDRTWVEAGTRRLALYSSLPPGRLRFRVVAANEDGVWNQEGAGFPLEVEPRFFQTGWFAAVVALALVLLGAGVQWLRLRRLELRQRELQAQVAARTAELADANRKIADDLVLLGRRDRELEALNRNLEARVSEQTAELRETRDTAILTLAKLAELRDGATGAHLERIAAYSRRLAEALRVGGVIEVGDDFVEQIARSSPLHDIGKVAIPDAILRKPGPLTQDERAIMRAHTTIGGDTLRSVLERYESQGYLTMAMEIAYHHHERWDGGGYPDRRAGAENSLPARIVALVDVFDALTSARPYKQALPDAEALRIIAGERGRHFDPALVDVFLTIAAELPELRRRVAAAGN